MRERHLLALSGGKDSAALAVYMRDKYPHLPMEYVFIDSGCELPETYAYLDRIRAVLGIEVITIRSGRGFEYWLKMFGGVLPSPGNRWCTRELKLKPHAAWLRENCQMSRVFNYTGLRADENRLGLQPGSADLVTVSPFVTDGLVLNDIHAILLDSGLGLPTYYQWRQRSGCYFCFYQQEAEWRGLRQHHPDLFAKACAFEEQHADARRFTWRQSGPLRDLTNTPGCPTIKEARDRGRLVSLLAGISASSAANALRLCEGDEDG